MKLLYKITAAAVATALIGTTTALCALTADNTDTKEVQHQADNVSQTVTSMLSGINADADGKEETVYIMTDGEGNNADIIVTNWLRNSSKADEIADVSDLTDIVNLKSDIYYTEDGENKVWAADGEDVYYSGKSDKSVPVNVNLTFTLDGQEISATDLAGKSGKVTITFNFTDIEKTTIASSEVYVPFAAVSSTMLDTDKFTNIEVTNGSIINDGDRCIVAGIAFPGLSDNMSSGSESVLPNSVIITADVKDFSLDGTLTAYTNDVFGNVDLLKFPSLQNIVQQLTAVTSQTTQLMTGLEQMSAGLSQLSSKYTEFTGGINTLSNGITSVSGGVSELSGYGKQLNDGAAQLYAGLNTIDVNTEALVAGAKQTFEALLSSTKAQLSASGITADLTIENYNTVLTKINASANSSAITQLIAHLDGYNQFYTALIAYTTGVSQSADASRILAEGATAMNTGITKIKQGTDQLLSGSKQISQYNTQIGSAISELALGSQHMSDGLAQFKQSISSKLSGTDLTTIYNAFLTSVEASKTYTTYSGKTDNIKSSVKFIVRTDSIG